MGSLVYLGSLISFIGAIWFVIIAIQTGKSGGEKAGWAIFNLFCQPISGIIFYIVKRVGLVPLLLVIVGAIIMGVGYPSLIAETMKNMPTK
jgi:hypothetical protein